MNPQEYTLNIRPGWGIPPTVKVSQYDVGRPLAFVLMDGQEALSAASGTTVTMEGTKPSGLGFTQACTLDGNTATISTTATMTQEAGCIPCELVVAVGNTTIGTANFKLVVELSAHPEGTTDGDRETAKDLMTRAEEAVAQAEAAAESISQAGIDTTGATAGQVPTAKGDGTWTWEDQQGGGTSTVDAELSTTSENPVQNKAIAAAVGSLNDQIANLSGGAPTPVSTVSGMVDTAKIYLYTGTETGYNSGHWYYYSGGAWVDGGAYGDAASVSEGVKAALLACFQKVAWIDENGQTYYDNLYNELYPPASLVSITAVYTQSGTVYDTASLDDIKPDLVVTANYSDGTSQTVTTYTLSGALAVGTSTVTVSYGGKTTTFAVVVSPPVYLYNNGDECTDITGGWVTTGFNTNTSYFTRTKEADHLSMVKSNTAQQAAAVSYSTANAIDFTGFNTLRIKRRYYKAGSGGNYNFWLYFCSNLNEASSQAGAYGSDYARAPVLQYPGNQNISNPDIEADYMDVDLAELGVTGEKYVSINANIWSMSVSGSFGEVYEITLL